jgi:hypothetical protein
MSEDKKTEEVQLTKEEVMERESHSAVKLLADDGLFMEQPEILKIMQEVDAECEVIMAGMRVWSDFICIPDTMVKIAGCECIDMQEVIQEVQLLDNIRQHLLQTAAWMMKLKMQTGAVPKVITPALGTEGKIIGLDGKEHVPE